MVTFQRCQKGEKKGAAAFPPGPIPHLRFSLLLPVVLLFALWLGGTSPCGQHPQPPEAAEEPELGWRKVNPREVPDRIRREAIGILTIWCSEEGMQLYGGTKADLEAHEKRKAEQREVLRYERSPAGFRSIGTLVVADTVPMSGLAHEGVVRHYPATAREGEFVEFLYDILEGKKTWVKLKGENEGPGCKVSFVPLKGSARVKFFEVDLGFFEPGRSLRIYTRPDPTAPYRTVTLPWDPPEVGSGWELVISEIQNGMGRLQYWPCGGDTPYEPGWVELRDEQGRIVVWWCDNCGCC